MCTDPDSLPPIEPAPGAATGDHVALRSADGTLFAAFVARPQHASSSGVVVCPDVRGLHHFYIELAMRLAEHGHAAIAFDYYARSAGVAERGEDFPYAEHLGSLNRALIQDDITASITELRSSSGTGARSVFTLGFCMGGRAALLAGTLGNDLAGSIGFYGFPGTGGRYSDDGPTQRAASFTAPVLALMGGADAGIPETENAAFDRALTAAGVAHEIVTYPGAPHSFFDKKQDAFAAESADAWRRVLAFLARNTAS